MEDLPAVTETRRFTGVVTELEVEANNFRRMVLELDRRIPASAARSRRAWRW